MLPFAICSLVYATIVAFLGIVLVTHPEAASWVLKTIGHSPALPVLPVDTTKTTDTTDNRDIRFPPPKPSAPDRCCKPITIFDNYGQCYPEEAPLQLPDVSTTLTKLQSNYSTQSFLLGMGLACLLITGAYFLWKFFPLSKSKLQQTQEELAQSLEDLVALRLALGDRQQPFEAAGAKAISVESIMVDIKTSNQEQYVREGHAILVEQETREEKMRKALTATVDELSKLQARFSQINDVNISLGRELDDEHKGRQKLMEENDRFLELARKKDKEVVELKTRSDQQEKDLVQVQELIHSLNKQITKETGSKTQLGQQNQELTQAKATIKSLEKKLANAEKSSQDFKQEKETLLRRAKAAEKTVTGVTTELNQRKIEVATNKKTINSLNIKVADTEKSLIESEQERKAIVQRAEESENTAAEVDENVKLLEKENETLAKRLEKRQKTLTDVTGNFQQLEQGAIVKKNLIQSLQQQLANKEESRLALEKENEALLQDAVQHEKTTVAFAKEVNGLEKSLRDHVANQEKTLLAFLDEKEALRYEIRQQNEMIVELTKEVDIRTERVSTLQEANEALQETKIDLERQAGIDKVWAKDLEEMLADAESFREQFAAERDSTVGKLSNEIAHLTKELNTAREVIADVTKDRDAYKTVRESTLGESNALRQLAENLRRSLDAVRSENEQLRGEAQYVQDTRTAYGNLIARLDVANGQENHLALQLTRSRQDIEEMQGKVEEARREKNEHKAQNTALRKSHEEYVARIKASFAAQKKRITDASARKASMMADSAIPTSANPGNFMEHRHTRTISAASSEDAEPYISPSRPAPASLTGGTKPFAQTTLFGKQLTSVLDVSSSTQALGTSPSATFSSATTSSSSKISGQTSGSNSAAISIAGTTLRETRVQRLHPSRSPVVQEVPAKAYVVVTATVQHRMDSVARKRRIITAYRKFEAGSAIFVDDHEKSKGSTLKDQQHIRNRRRSIAGCESQAEMDLFTCFLGSRTIAPSPTADPAKFGEPYYLERLFGTTRNNRGKIVPRHVFKNVSEAFKAASKTNQVAMHTYTMHGGSRGFDHGPPSPISIDVDTSGALKRESIYNPNRLTAEPFWHPFEARAKLRSEEALQSAGVNSDNYGLVQDVQSEIDGIAVAGTTLKDVHRQLVLGRNPSWKPPAGAPYVVTKHNIAQILRLAGREELVAKFSVNPENVSTLRSTPQQQTPILQAPILSSNNAAHSTSSHSSVAAKFSMPLSPMAASFTPLTPVALPAAEPTAPAVLPTTEPIKPAVLPTKEATSKSNTKPAWKNAIQYQQSLNEVSTPYPTPAMNQSNTASTSLKESKWSTVPDLPSPAAVTFPSAFAPAAKQSKSASKSVANSKWSTAPDTISPAAINIPARAANPSNLAAEASATPTAKERGPYAATPGYEMEPSKHANGTLEVNDKKSSNYRQQKNNTGARFNSRNNKKSRNQW